MVKKIIAIALGLGGVLFGVGFALHSIGFSVFKSKPAKETIVNFIKEHPEKASIKLVRNDSIIVALNVDRVMPLASTVKLIVAIEYASQVADGIILPGEKIPFSDLDKYYVKNTDGGAHSQWIKSLGESIKDSVSIKEIAIGMLRFSSNANTEWLKDKLGPDRVNARLDSLGIKNHTPIFYMVSALFVGKEKFPDASGNDLAARIREMPMDEFRREAARVHSLLKDGGNYKSNFGDLSEVVQKAWSDKLPASTTNEYCELMRKINSRTFLRPSVQLHLDEVLEWIMKNPSVNSQFYHMGMKGGSTLFVMTKALYATDKNGNKTELAYFFNDLTPDESQSIQTSMGEFERAVLGNKQFRENLKSVSR